MKFMLVLVVSAVSLMILGQETGGGLQFRRNKALKTVKSMSPEQRALMIRQKRDAVAARNGGYIEAPVTGKVICVVNRQNRVNDDNIKISIAEISSNLGLVFDLVRDKQDEIKAAVTVEIVDESRAPSILVAPEDCWGKINVARLGVDNPSSELLSTRLAKELWRVLAMTMGASNSNFKPSVMHNVFSLADLDADPAMVPCPEVFDKVQKTAWTLGVSRRRIANYRKACREGWAPAPTNDIQRAIWEQIKADKERGPAKPLTIPPPAKK